jgi:hypothetical protein
LATRANSHFKKGLNQANIASSNFKQEYKKKLLEAIS